MRTHTACDGCTLRRVKCEGTQPCAECRKRSLDCTFLRARRKPGPKGPRLSTAQRIKEFQKNESVRLGVGVTGAGAGVGVGVGIGVGVASKTAAAAATLNGDEGSSPGSDSTAGGRATTTTTSSNADALFEAPSPSVDLLPGHAGPRRQNLPVEEYFRFLEIFERRLRAVWPVVDCDALRRRLVENGEDYENRSLAAALCSSVIAQLRLPEHTQTVDGVSSYHFALDAEYFRTLFDYRETFTIASLMTSFFLHIYYANTQKLRTGGILLRECVSFAQVMLLDQPSTYSGLDRAERELRLQVFWLLFVSERTFCAENRLPPILAPIGDLPAEERGENGTVSSSSAFLCLVRLFIHLERDFVETSPTPAAPSHLGERERDRVSQYQSNLSLNLSDGPFNETQWVDLFVTRQWIRTLLWEYTVRHFSMSCKPDDQAFSMLLPVSIAHETLSLFQAVSQSSLKPHGYGMELKVFRMADSLVDTLACIPATRRGDSMLVGPRDILRSLEQVLSAVGGPNSSFLARLQQCMAEAGLPASSPTYVNLAVESSSDDTEAIAEQSDTGSSPSAGHSSC